MLTNSRDFIFWILNKRIPYVHIYQAHAVKAVTKEYNITNKHKNTLINNITKLNFSSKIFDSIQEEKKKKLIFGISKRVDKVDKFRALHFDYCLMDFNSNIIYKNTASYKMLDFQNNLYLKKSERTQFIYKSNNAHLNFFETHQMLDSDLAGRERLYLNSNYEQEFEKNRIKELSK